MASGRGALVTVGQVMYSMFLLHQFNIARLCPHYSYFCQGMDICVGRDWHLKRSTNLCFCLYVLFGVGLSVIGNIKCIKCIRISVMEII